MSERKNDLTRQLASAAEEGADPNPLFDLIYPELVRLARAELARHRREATLDTRALVNEAYLKLFGGSAGAGFNNRKHFFASAALVMRQIVVDFARRRLAERRGAGMRPLDLDDHIIAVDSQAEQLVAIDTALDQLAERDPRLAEIAELKFFAGLSVVELAELLEVSTATVKRDTRLAKAFLKKQLERPAA